eukprot:SAG22_NODE_200_length_15420_cov_4.424581_7_plen_222_part_00
MCLARPSGIICSTHGAELIDAFKNGRCAQLTPTSRNCFPTLTFMLSPAVQLKLTPTSYMLPTGNGRALFYCLGIGQSSSAQTLLGDVLIQQYYVDFDRAGRRVGFAPRNIKNCGGSTTCEADHDTCSSCAADPACFWCPQQATCVNSTQVHDCVEACNGDAHCRCQGDVLGLFRLSDIFLIGATVVLLLGSQVVYWRAMICDSGGADGGGSGAGGGSANPM